MEAKRAQANAYLFLLGFVGGLKSGIGDFSWLEGSALFWGSAIRN